MLYADYNGSAPICNEVKEYLIDRIANGPYSNPNAIHSLGKKMMFGMEKCRRHLAKHLGCQSAQIIFNSGSSEGISQIFYSLLDDKKCHAILSGGVKTIVFSADAADEKLYKELRVNGNLRTVLKIPI